MLERAVVGLWAALHGRDEGATMPEYALIVALVAIFLIAGAAALATEVGQKFIDNGQAILNA